MKFKNLSSVFPFVSKTLSSQPQPLRRLSSETF